MTRSGNKRGSSELWILFVFSTFLTGAPDLVSVKVKDTAILACNKTCSGHLKWAFKTDNENLDVLRCEKKNCTEGDSFKNRVSFVPANVQSGILILKLYPVLYNDEGWYEVKCDWEIICKFHLEVFVPTTINVSVGSNIKLPCYARTEKQISDESVNIVWKKDGQIVFKIPNGVLRNISGYSERISVSLEDYKKGDLSLMILKATPSDTGLYQCYHKASEEHGYPGAITFNIKAEERVWTKKLGEDLIINLFGLDVTVTFTDSNAVVSDVCSVMGSSTTCSPDYINRVSVKNDSLVLSGLTSSDNGTFSVKDKMGNVIAVNTVAVEDTDYQHIYVTLCVLAGFILVCICLFIRYKCQQSSQATEKCQYYNVRGSSVDIDLQREPAWIREPEQETSPHLSECEVRPRTPVEETMPDTNWPNEKRDNTMGEEYIGQVVSLNCS